MTTHTVTLQGSRLHKNSQQRLCGGLLLRALLLSFFVKWWTHHLDQQSAGSRVVRSPAAARVAPPLKPRWLKVGDAFRRLRLLPRPPAVFQFHTQALTVQKKEGCCPRRKVFLSVLSVIGRGPCGMKLPPLSFCFTLLNTFCFPPPFFSCLPEFFTHFSPLCFFLWGLSWPYLHTRQGFNMFFFFFFLTPFLNS